jgi:glutamate formiminotransferase/formiminotetrahydrofolate cyclodeaminase
MNVKINASGLEDRKTAEKLLAEANEVEAGAAQFEGEIVQIVESKMG